MRSLRKKAPADLAAMGGRAAHQALIARLGEDGYRDRQRAGFEAACEKHGRRKILSHIAIAHEERRRWRLSNPTAAESALIAAVEALGFAIHPITHEAGDLGFEYQHWRHERIPALGQADLVREARVGPYFVDVLIPALAVAIEVDGGVHQLRPDYDERRRRWLQGIGLSVHTFANETVLAGLGDSLDRLLQELRP
jgi:very-short-patch-repair endonuclease